MAEHEHRSIGVTVSMTLSTLKKIDRDAKRQGVDRSAWIMEAVKKKLDAIATTTTNGTTS